MSKQDKNIESIYPLSPMQQGLLFHTLLAPKSGVYFQQILYTLTGSLQEAAFQLAWQQAVDRHEPLRTLFVWEGQEKPLQVVRRRVALPWEQLDWRGLSGDEQTVKLAAFLQTDRQRGFDLAQAPLIRLALIRMDQTRYELIWSHHHLLIDGWSSFLILKDVMAIYRALKEGLDCRLGPLRPYRDYINWLQKYEQSKAESYWRAALKGFTVPTNLLGSKAEAGHAGGDYVAAQQVFHLSSSLMDAMKLFAKRHNLTLSTLVHAAWAMMLSRYSGEHDIVFGSIGSGRSAELEGIDFMVGLFVNTLPVRAQFSPQDSVLAWLRDFQSQLAELRQYEHSPLVDVQGWSEVDRGHPLFESIMVFENYPVDTSAWGQDGTLQISNMRVLGPTNYPLTAIFVPGKDLYVRASYDSRRIDAAAISRMLGHLNALLEGILFNPDQRLSDLSMLSEEERGKILAWNRTEAPFPHDASVSEVFERQAAKTPDAIALEHGTTHWSYRELNARANRFAQVLQDAGAETETRVGLCLERSAEMVMAMLAVLKAGGAYVPIDPAYPAARRFFMLEGVPLLVTTRPLARGFARHAGRIICVEDEPAALARQENLPRRAHGGSLAYVMYTSGSTGQPKGVAIPHRAVNRLVLHINYISLDGSDVVAQTSNFCFDAATFEVWGALLNGARLVVIDKDMILSPTDLAEELRRRGITTLWLTTSLFNLMAQHAPRAFSGLRNVLFGGEAADARSVAEVLKHGAPRHLINGYGPTETTTFAACHEVRSVPENAMTIPIGKPISNTTLYILDAWRNPVPIGVHGEIHVGGLGLARGYVGAPELTAERFLPDPFSDQPGARLYRTGDLGRWLADGTVECLGRMDDQVKIRGFRIEPGEVEATLKGYPGVCDAVVVLRGQAGDEKRLVAYVAGEPLALREAALRDHLKSKLPDYMVPSALVILEQLPLNANGKVDRRAFPEPAAIPTEKAPVRPRDSLETQLVAIWEKVLENAPIGVTDDFFELGGNSLRAVRVFAEIKKAFGRNLPLVTLFKTPTVETLAQALRTENRAVDWSPLVPIQLRGDRPPFFGIHGVTGNILFYRPLAQLLGKEQPFYGIQSQGLDGEPITRISIEAMAEYYIEQIQRVQPHGPYLLGGYSLGGSIAYEMARRLRLAGEAVPLLALIDAGNPARPRRLVSYRARLRKALRDPASLFTADRFARILAGRIRGKAGGQFLKWNDLYQKTKSRLAKKSGRNGADDVTDLHIQMVHAQAFLAFRPLPLNGRITLFRTLIPEPGYEYDPYLGWDSLATDGVEVHEVPGAHVELFSDESVPALAKILDGCIQSAMATDPCRQTLQTKREHMAFGEGDPGLLDRAQA